MGIWPWASPWYYSGILFLCWVSGDYWRPDRIVQVYLCLPYRNIGRFQKKPLGHSGLLKMRNGWSLLKAALSPTQVHHFSTCNVTGIACLAVPLKRNAMPSPGPRRARPSEGFSLVWSRDPDSLWPFCLATGDQPEKLVVTICAAVVSRARVRILTEEALSQPCFKWASRNSAWKNQTPCLVCRRYYVSWFRLEAFFFPFCLICFHVECLQLAVNSSLL